MEDSHMQDTSEYVQMNVESRFADQLTEYLARLQLDDTEPELDQKTITKYKQATVNKITDHRVKTNGQWDFQVLFSDGIVEWVPEKYCSCDELVSEYLSKKEYKTLYCVSRVSTKQQAGTDTVSLDAQQNEINKNLSKFGKFDRVKMVRIVSSAYQHVPKDLRQLSANVVKGDLIMVYAIDRLSRNIFKYADFFENIQSKGANVYSVKENLNYRDHKTHFMKFIIDAQAESEAISRRIKLSREERRKNGDEFRGRLKYGQKYAMNANGTRKIVNHPDELRIIQVILSMFKDNRSVNDITKGLNDKKLLKRNKPWNSQMVRRIIKEYYVPGPIGKLKSKKQPKYTTISCQPVININKF